MKGNRALTVLIVLACTLSIVVALRPSWLDCRWSRDASALPVRLVLPPNELSKARLRRLNLKYLAVQHLAAGELTLFETAAIFRQLNSQPPVQEDGNLPGLSGTDEGERLCRQVIRWARGEWEQHFRPEEVKARLDRLEQELQEHIVAHGGVRLPDDLSRLGIPTIPVRSAESWR